MLRKLDRMFYLLVCKWDDLCVTILMFTEEYPYLASAVLAFLMVILPLLVILYVYVQFVQ